MFNKCHKIYCPKVHMNYSNVSPIAAHSNIQSSSIVTKTLFTWNSERHGGCLEAADPLTSASLKSLNDPYFKPAALLAAMAAEYQ